MFQEFEDHRDIERPVLNLVYCFSSHDGFKNYLMKSEFITILR